MSYAIADLELTAPLAPIRLGNEDRGVALLVRSGGRPVHFSLHELEPRSVLDETALRRLLQRHAAADLVADELAGHLGAASSADHSAAAPSVTLAVCTRARTELLATCLASITRMLGAASVAGVDVLVVDNAPPDDRTRRLVEGIEDVRYVLEPRPGLDFARNRVLAESCADFVAFLDDDVEVDAGWLHGLRAALAEHPDAGSVTGLVLPFELATPAQIAFERRGGFRRGFRQLRYEGDRLPGNPLYPVGAGIFGAGCNMAFRRATVVALGGFDEALDTGAPLPGGGDLDMFYRVVRAGLALVYEPRMAVLHKHRREHAALRRQYWTWGTGFMAFLSKTYSADYERRGQVRRMVGWWLVDQGRQLRACVRRRGDTPIDLVAAELAGGLVGLTGSYRRSQRRVNRIRTASA